MSKESFEKMRDEVEMDDSIFWPENLEEDMPENPIVLADIKEDQQGRLRKLFDEGQNDA